MATEVAIGGAGALFAGEDKTLSLHVLDTSGVPVDIAGWGIAFVVKVNVDAAAALTKTATITGTYDADHDVNTQRAVVTLSDTDTDALSGPRQYRHSWKRTDNGFETVLAYGKFVVEQAPQ